MNHSDLHYRQLHEVSALLASNDVSSVDVTGWQLDRIAELEPQLKTFAYIATDDAYRAAEESDARRAAGAVRGPLDGVPMGIKDILDKTGWPTQAGMKVRQGIVADSDATAVRRLEDAGAVIVGKVHTTEGVYTEHTPPFEAPVNPWDPDRWVGVSSSGSGVATAAGLCFGTLGSDTGGSIRMPSASNGVTGLKPTWGRVSRAGAVELAATLDHIGPMCRSARDAGMVLQVIAGADERDPTASLANVPDYLGANTDNLRGVRIGVDRSWSAGVSADVLAAQAAAEVVLTELGAIVEPITLPDSESAIDDWFGVCAVQTARAHALTFPSQRGSYGPALRELLELGNRMSGTQYQQLILDRLAFAGRMDAAVATVDVVLIPAMSFIAPKSADMVRMDDETTAGVHRFTVPFTMSGHPTLTFPAGFVSSSPGREFPVALQLVAQKFDEQMLVRVGHAFQQHTDWANRHPTL